MGLFIGWIIFAFVAGAIGSDRKIGFLGAFFLSLFLSPLIGIIVALASKRKDTEEFQKKILENSQNSPSDNYIDQLYKLTKLREAGNISEQEYEREKDKLESSRPTTVSFYDGSGKGYNIMLKDSERFVKVPKDRNTPLRLNVVGRAFAAIIARDRLGAKWVQVIIKLNKYPDLYVDVSEAVNDASVITSKSVYFYDSKNRGYRITTKNMDEFLDVPLDANNPIEIIALSDSFELLVLGGGYGVKKYLIDLKAHSSNTIDLNDILN